MRPLHYTLDEDGRPVPEPDLMRWGLWMQTVRHLALTEVSPEILVSTVFLGLDHSFCDAAPPLLWETMVFGGPLDGEQARYNSLEDAMGGHNSMVARVLAADRLG